MRRVIGLALGFYFRRIERFHIERVPVGGPVLFVSNHPNSLTDSFVIGSSVPRKVNFIGTAVVSVQAGEMAADAVRRDSDQSREGQSEGNAQCGGYV